MKLAFFINNILTEKNNYTTIRLARRAIKMGHDVALVGIGDLIYESDERVSALASVPNGGDYADDQVLLDELQADDAASTYICLSEYDIVVLRSDPADELLTRPWVTASSLLFAQLLAKQGVIVLNDPTHMTDASNKTYFQTYPEIVRPKTMIARNTESIREAVKKLGGKAVIKPLQGSGGQGVFVVDEHSEANLNQIIDATVRDGYAIVQEYLPLAAEGDIRLLTLNGRPFKVDNEYACFRRYNTSGDARSNISAGGKYELAKPDDDIMKVAELVGPKLIRDGMYFTGLDIVGDKMMEINVDTPGGINMAEDLTGVDFSGAFIQDLERKCRLNKYYGGRISVTELAIV